MPRTARLSATPNQPAAMSLTLRAVSLDDRPLSHPLAACFGPEGGTIGRADHNTLALPDPERHISRRQAQVAAAATGFVITNVGSAIAIAISGQLLGPGQCAPLRHQDRLRIGGYVIEAIEDDAGAGAGAAMPQPPVPARGDPAAAAMPRGAAGSGAEAEAETEALLWAAFCEGAGVALQCPREAMPLLMRTVGALLRQAVDGTLELMSVRASARQALHADMTLIQARDNNPLKISPDVQSALELLLRPPLRGFLDGPAAMQDAMEDLVGHAVGTLAGTRAALDSLLGRVAPQALEGQLGSGGLLHGLLPMSRRARLWELYLQHFEALRGEAREDSDLLFGPAFLAAYEQQLQRLRQSRGG